MRDPCDSSAHVLWLNCSRPDAGLQTTIHNRHTKRPKNVHVVLLCQVLCSLWYCSNNFLRKYAHICVLPCLVFVISSHAVVSSMSLSASLATARGIYLLLCQNKAARTVCIIRGVYSTSFIYPSQTSTGKKKFAIDFSSLDKSQGRPFVLEL